MCRRYDGAPIARTDAALPIEVATIVSRHALAATAACTLRHFHTDSVMEIGASPCEIHSRSWSVEVQPSDAYVVVAARDDSDVARRAGRNSAERCAQRRAEHDRRKREASHIRIVPGWFIGVKSGV